MNISAAAGAERFLVEEATRRTGLVWLALPDRARPAWHVWQDGAAYVVTGGAEQPLPGLLALDHVVVTVASKDTRARLLSWRARVERIAPGSGAWSAVLPALLAGRLNLPDAATAGDRWARESAIVRLEPTGEVLDAPGRAATGAALAPPPPTPAATAEHRASRRTRHAG